MVFTTKECYALRIVYYLIKKRLDGNTGTVPCSVIAEDCGLPQGFTKSIANELAKRGVLFSERGRYGGFGIAGKLALTVTVLDVIEAVGGGEVPESTDLAMVRDGMTWRIALNVAALWREAMDGMTVYQAGS